MNGEIEIQEIERPSEPVTLAERAMIEYLSEDLAAGPGEGLVYRPAREVVETGAYWWNGMGWRYSHLLQAEQVVEIHAVTDLDDGHRGYCFRFFTRRTDSFVMLESLSAAALFAGPLPRPNSDTMDDMDPRGEV